MEDTPDKIRRNIVTLSAGIVFFWFLDLKLSGDLKLFGIAPLSGVSPLKLWICVTTVLTYMFLRYRFDENSSRQFFLIKQDSREIWRKFFEPKLRTAFLAIISGTQSMAKESEAIDLFYGSEPLEQVAPTNFSWQSEPSSNLEATLLAPSVWKRRVEVQFGGNFVWKTTDSGSASLFVCEARLPLRAYVLLFCWTPVRVLLYSKSSVDVIVPHVLAGAAFLICLSNVALAI